MIQDPHDPKKQGRLTANSKAQVRHPFDRYKVGHLWLTP